MKRVELYGRVRHAVMIEGLSQREAARCFGIDPRTVRKMLSYSAPPGYVRTRPPVRPKLDPFIGIIDRILEEDIPVLEVTGPDPASRRAKGKDDALDAISAAEAARTRRRVQVAKDRSGSVEALRVLRTTRKTAIKCRRAALQQLYNTIVAAPEEVRDQVRNLTRMQRLRTCAAWRPDTVGYRDPVVSTKLSLKSLARRILDINDEIAELDRFIVPLVEELAPSLLELEGVGTENAGAVMVAVGDNPDRLRSEASFAMMCGVCLAHPETLKHRPCRSHAVNVTMPARSFRTAILKTSFCVPSTATSRSSFEASIGAVSFAWVRSWDLSSPIWKAPIAPATCPWKTRCRSLRHRPAGKPGWWTRTAFPSARSRSNSWLALSAAIPPWDRSVISELGGRSPTLSDKNGLMCRWGIHSFTGCAIPSVISTDHPR